MTDGLSAEDIALLRGKNYAYLVTLNADGTPHVTPLGSTPPTTATS